MSMLPEKVFVGLDYHLKSVQVCVLDSDGNQLVNATRPNDVRSVAEVVPAGVEVEAAIESCCGAANFAELPEKSRIEEWAKTGFTFFQF